MSSSWGQVLSLAVLALNLTRIVAIDWSGIGDDIKGTATSIGSDIKGAASGLVGDLENDFDTFKNAVESKLEDALVKGGGVLAQFTMGYETIPPVRTHIVTSGVQSNVTVGLFCYSCSGATQPSAFDFASSYSGYSNESWLGFALDNFEALFEVDIELAKVTNGELTLSLLKIPAAADGVVVEVEFQLYVVANASVDMSFTTGLNLTLMQPAALMMPALDPIVKLNETKRIGFDQQSFNLAPIFNATIPTLEFDVQFSLRTVFSVTVEEINIGTLQLDLPAFNLGVNTIPKALSNCQPATAGTPSNEIYEELIHVSGELVAELSYELLNGAESGVLERWTIWDAFDECYAFFPGLASLGPVPASSKSPLLTAAAVTSCTSGGRTTVGTAAFGEALKSLSPGAKVAVVIGTLLGVALVSALAWFGGRASLKHSINNGGASERKFVHQIPGKFFTRGNQGGIPSAWTMPRPRSGKFFSGDNLGGTAWTIPRPRLGKFFSRKRGETEFTPVAPGAVVSQTFPYQGGGGSIPNMQEQQQQYDYQQWQKSQNDIFVTVNEDVTPAPTFVSMSDDNAMPPMPIYRAQEPDRMRSDTRIQPARYQAVGEGGQTNIYDGYGMPTMATQRAEDIEIMRYYHGSPPTDFQEFRTAQPERQGLLQGGRRPVIPRKEVLRKEVPRQDNWGQN